MAAISVFHSRFFARRSSSQKELRSSRAAKDSVQKTRIIIQYNQNKIGHLFYNGYQLCKLKTATVVKNLLEILKIKVLYVTKVAVHKISNSEICIRKIIKI